MYEMKTYVLWFLVELDDKILGFFSSFHEIESAEFLEGSLEQSYEIEKSLKTTNLRLLSSVLDYEIKYQDQGLTYRVFALEEAQEEAEFISLNYTGKINYLMETEKSLYEVSFNIFPAKSKMNSKKAVVIHAA